MKNFRDKLLGKFKKEVTPEALEKYNDNRLTDYIDKFNADDPKVYKAMSDHSDQLHYDSVRGQFKKGDKVGALSDFKEQIKQDDFNEQFKKDKQTALKGFYPRVYDKEFENTLRTVQGKKKKLSDIDLLFSAADPKEKREMRKNYKEYDFSKRKLKEDIVKITEPVVTPPKPVEVPSIDVGELIKQRANNRAAMEKAQSVRDYGAHGLGHLKLKMEGLDD